MKNKMTNNNTGRSKGRRWVFKCDIKLQRLLSLKIQFTLTKYTHRYKIQYSIPNKGALFIRKGTLRNVQKIVYLQ